MLDNAIFFEIEFKILEERIKQRIQESTNKERRKDDNIETLLNRIEVFKSSTLPIVEYYEEKSILSKINAMDKIETINLEILKIIRNVSFNKRY